MFEDCQNESTNKGSMQFENERARETRIYEGNRVKKVPKKKVNRRREKLEISRIGQT